MGGKGPRKERTARTIFLTPAAAQTLSEGAHSPSSVFLFSFLLFPPARDLGGHCPSSCVRAGLSFPALPALPRPASSGAWAGGPPIIPAGAHGGRHCRGGGGQLPAWLPSPPPARLVWRGRYAHQPIPAAGRAGAGPPGSWTCPAGRRGHRGGCLGAALAGAQARGRSLADRESRGTPPPPSR